MRHGLAARGLAGLAGVIAVGMIAACGGVQAGNPGGVARLPATHAVGSPRPYELYTHCGIEEARVGPDYFQAVHPLTDGVGNPPPGWGNPYQAGTMTALSATEILFRDTAGHHVLFQLRPGATGFQHICS